MAVQGRPAEVLDIEQLTIPAATDRAEPVVDVVKHHAVGRQRLTDGIARRAEIAAAFAQLDAVTDGGHGHAAQAIEALVQPDIAHPQTMGFERRQDAGQAAANDRQPGHATLPQTIRSLLPGTAWPACTLSNRQASWVTSSSDSVLVSRSSSPAGV